MHLNIRTIASLLVCLTGTVAAWGYPFGPPNGVTIAPGDRPGVSCTACHNGTALNGGGGSVRLAFPNGLTYTPGQTQNINLVINDAIAATSGFEITARMEASPNTQQAGSFIAGTNQKVICSDNTIQPAAGCGGNGIQWMEHSQPSLSSTIAIQWTPPATNAGNVHIYVSANAANGDNTRSGDHIYAADYVLTPASTSTANLPVVTSVLNAASGAATMEAGSWITIAGTNLATAPATWDTAIIGNVYPTTLGGTTVAIDGKPAPISFASPTQINALVPATNTLGSVSVVVSNANGTGAPGTLTLAPASPGLFTFSQNQGRYAAGIVLDSGGFEYLGPTGLLGSTVQSRPAKAGDSIQIYGTGFGPTVTPLNPELSASVAYPLAHTGPDITLPLAQVTIGGVPAQLQFCGIVAPGLYQINAVVPPGLTPGDQPVKVTLLSGPTVPQTTFIAVQ